MGQRRPRYFDFACSMFVRCVFFLFATIKNASYSIYVVAAVAWSVVYSLSITQAVELALLMIFRDFVLSGIFVATLLWYGSILLGAMHRLTTFKGFFEQAFAFAAITLHAS